MIDLTVAATVALLVPYLSKGAEGMAEEFGRDAASGVQNLFGLVKAKLTKPAASEALDDLEADVESADNQAGLRVQLAKALDTDPELRAELERLVEQIQAAQPALRASQSMTVAGDNNDTFQVQGNANSIQGRTGA